MVGTAAMGRAEKGRGADGGDGGRGCGGHKGCEGGHKGCGKHRSRGGEWCRWRTVAWNQVRHGATVGAGEEMWWRRKKRRLGGRGWEIGKIRNGRRKEWRIRNGREENGHGSHTMLKSWKKKKRYTGESGIGSFLFFNDVWGGVVPIIYNNLFFYKKTS